MGFSVGDLWGFLHFWDLGVSHQRWMDLNCLMNIEMNECTFV